MIAQSNATLVKVERVEGTSAGGYSEDWDAPATDPEAAGGEGIDVWNGQAPAYYRERRHRDRTPDGRDVFVDRLLIVDEKQPPVEFAEGDVLTWAYGSVTDTGRVQAVERHSLAGQPGTTRLTLEEG